MVVQHGEEHIRGSASAAYRRFAPPLDSGQVIRWRSWHRWSALCLLACIYLAVAAASHRDRRPGLETGLIPLTIPELVRLLRDTVIPPPCRDQAHRQHWSRWRRRHQYRASQARPALACLHRCHTMITTNVGRP
jgi:hypothetical protein